MARTRRQIVISDDEDEDSYNDTSGPQTPTPKLKPAATQRSQTRDRVRRSITDGVNALEISNGKQELEQEPTIDISDDEDEVYDDMANNENLETPKKFHGQDDDVSAILATPMITSTPVTKPNFTQPKVQVAHLEPLAPTRKSFNDILPPPMQTKLHLPPPKLTQGENNPTQYTNDGLVAVSPSKGRLRSMAAEQAFQEKDLPPRPRLVISKLALTNFKSYAGRQEIGPFHSVSKIRVCSFCCAIL